MSQEICPACESSVEIGDNTLATCPRCQVCFVPAQANEVTLVTQVGDELTRSGEQVRLPREFQQRYRLGRLLGSGAMGTVYEAVQLRSGTRVAIKFFTRVGDPQLLRRFVGEAQMLSRIEHCNVLGVVEALAMDRHPCMVCELAEGGSLGDRLKADPAVPLREALRILAEILEGLEACHQAGVVHRDLKPDNVLVTAAGQMKIADLGIARDSTRDTFTAAGAVIGTPRYMSPEQLNGEKVEPASDLYAASLIGYQMMAGEHPFRARTMPDLVVMHLTVVPAELTTLGREVPPEVSRVVAQGLAKSAAQRPASAGAMATVVRKALEQLEGKPAAIRDPTPATRARPPAAASTPVAVSIAAASTPVVADGPASPGAASSLGSTAPGRRPGAVRKGAPLAVTQVPRVASPRRGLLAAGSGLAVLLLAVAAWRALAPDVPSVTEARSSPELASVVTRAPPSAASAVPSPASPSVAASPAASRSVSPSSAASPAALPASPSPASSPSASPASPSPAASPAPSASPASPAPPASPGPSAVASASPIAPEVVESSDPAMELPGLNRLGPNAQGLELYENPKDYSRMVLIPAGEFTMGSDFRGHSDWGPPHRVQVADFLLDEHEVSVQRFQEFVSATGYETEAEKSGGLPGGIPGASWRYPLGQSSGATVDPQAAVTNVTWNDAMAYCQWAGTRLPTEAEWERAAKAGDEGAVYPWPGTEAVPDRDGWFAQSLSALPKPVGSYSPNAFGLFDMAGNAEEWCADWYAAGTYRRENVVDPTGPDSGTDRVTRGGGYAHSFDVGIRSDSRRHAPPGRGLPDTGFRCARSLRPDEP